MSALRNATQHRPAETPLFLLSGAILLSRRSKRQIFLRREVGSAAGLQSENSLPMPLLPSRTDCRREQIFLAPNDGDGAGQILPMKVRPSPKKIASASMLSNAKGFPRRFLA